MLTADCPGPSSHCRPTWAEIDIKALKDNYRTLKSLLTPTSNERPRIIPVIKAEAYGHGMLYVARALASEDITMFAVSTVEEGIRLRQYGITQDILVLGTCWAGQETVALRNHLTLACDNSESIRRLEMEAQSMDVPAAIHIKVDTGMGRLGIQWDSLTPLLQSLKRAEKVLVKGTFSHLSSADEIDPSYTLKQTRRFEHSLKTIRQAGLDPGEIHFANSAGLLCHKHLRSWGARTGIALYGYVPDYVPIRLNPILSLKTRIIAVRTISFRESVGYSRKFTASCPTRIAVLAIGYADGFNRRLSNCGKVIIRGRYAPVIGTISMDMTTIDLTSFPEIQVGEEVVLIGSAGECHMTAADWANILQTIPYEVLCAIATRVPRILLRD